MMTEIPEVEAWKAARRQIAESPYSGRDAGDALAEALRTKTDELDALKEKLVRFADANVKFVLRVAALEAERSHHEELAVLAESAATEALRERDEARAELERLKETK